MGLKQFLVCCVFLILVLFIGHGNGLSCFRCNSAFYSFLNDPCQSMENIQQQNCPEGGPQACVSASIVAKKDSWFPYPTVYLTVRNCVPNTALVGMGSYCDHIFQKIQNEKPVEGIILQGYERCKVCSTDYCNLH